VVISRKDDVVAWFCSLHNKFDNYKKGMVNRSVVICNTFTLSLVFDINIVIIQHTCMFLLTSVLKGFNDNHRSKSKATAKWISIEVSHLNNVRSLQNYILLLCTLILG